MQRNDTVTNLIPLPLESEVVPPLEEIAVAGSDIGRPEERILVAINLFDQMTSEQLSRHLSYSHPVSSVVELSNLLRPYFWRLLFYFYFGDLLSVAEETDGSGLAFPRHHLVITTIRTVGVHVGILEMAAMKTYDPSFC